MGRRPLVLLTNDDGCNSAGLLAAWQAIRNLADTLIIVPECPVGGAGKSITVYRPVRVSNLSLQEMKGHKTDGTPADCVLLGLHKFAERRPDLVVSGINLGPNLGLDDLTSSGTMGACIQAAMYGIPSVCASYCLHDYSRMPSLQELATAKKVVEVIAAEILRKDMLGRSRILVVAIPEGGEVRQARETRLAASPLPDIHKEVGQGVYQFMPRTLDLYRGKREGDDVSAVLERVISLTAVDMAPRSRESVDLTGIVNRVNEELNRA